MYRRVVATFSAFAFIFGLLAMRILQIQSSPWAASAAANSSITVYSDTGRGIIYDCDMRPITYMDHEMLAAVKPTEAALKQLEPILTQEKLTSLYSQLSNGNPVVLALDSSQLAIKSGEDVTVTQHLMRYSNTAFACHLIGYVGGASGAGESGLEKAYDDWLNQFSGEFCISYSVDANGRLLAGERAQISDTIQDIQGGIQLTINRDIQRVAEDAMDQNGISRGQ